MKLSFALSLAVLVTLVAGQNIIPDSRAKLFGYTGRCGG
jgi:hypothetical protein